MLRIKNLISMFFAFLVLAGNAQNFIPIITQFSKKDYKASNQSWSLTQGVDGTMYFGNNSGLLQFDGSTWNIYPANYNQIVRSVYADKSGRVYIGCFEEFGYFEKDNAGILKYTSLSEKLKKYKMKNDEVWNIIESKGRIIFQSFQSYFIFDGKTIKSYNNNDEYLFFGKFNEDIYVNSPQKGFCKLELETAKLIPINNSVLNSAVISMIQVNKNLMLLATKSSGLFFFDGKNITKFKTDDDALLQRCEINRTVISKDSIILLGSILNGVVALDLHGKKLWNLNTSNGLQNNTVLGMHCDNDNNLWLALDKGISFVALNSSIRYIHSFSPSVGSIYSVLYKNPYLFIATNQGLYRANYDENNKIISDIRLYQNVKGQVWNLSEFDGQIFCGHNEKTYEIYGDNISTVSNVSGGMCIKKSVINNKEVLVQGTYTRICIYTKENGKWKFSHSLNNFMNPIRYIEIDYKGIIWASHMHKGLFAIKLSPDLKNIEHLTVYKSLDKKGQNVNINVFNINNRVVFTDHQRFYTYDDIRKEIIPYKELNNALGKFSDSYKVAHFNGNLYWFIKDTKSALVDVKDGNIRILDVVNYSLFTNQIVDDYQEISKVSNHECFLTLENSLGLYSINELKIKKQYGDIHIKSILTFDDEAKNKVYLSLENQKTPSIPYKRNNITFTVSFPYYSEINNLKFRYKLSGLDKVWSEPTASPSKTYNYLTYGKYVLNVEVISKGDTVLKKLSYKINVNPPFYLSIFAKLIYLLFSIGLLYMIYVRIDKNFHRKKEKIKKEHEELRKKEIEKREQQILTLEKEKLESELSLKSKELAASTMSLIKKNELLNNIKEEITSLKKTLGNQYPNKYYDKLIKLLDENISSEDDWSIFQTNFDRIHENFFRNLHIKYPELTSNDLRFCAYLRLNLSTKDIAHLMNISPKGVEVGRYRIRKKIGLPSYKSLTEFMIEFK